jgi:hypothetical protein
MNGLKRALISKYLKNLDDVWDLILAQDKMDNFRRPSADRGQRPPGGHGGAPPGGPTT